MAATYLQNMGFSGISMIFYVTCLMFVMAEYKHDEDHLTVSCNVERYTTVGGRLESSTKLTYENNMDCTFKVSAPFNKKISIAFNYFETENKLSGKCLDYMNIHDGGSTASPTLNAEPLCEVQKSLPFYATSDREVTFHFVTDETAVSRGFDLIYTVYSHAPCSAGDFACNDSMCIDPSLKCDGYEQCDDGSDESTDICTVISVQSSALSMGLIVGCSAAGLVGLIILAYIIYKVVDYYNWQKWLANNDLQRNPWDEEDFQYPVTEHYHSKLPFVGRTKVSPTSTPPSNEKRGDVTTEAEVTAPYGTTALVENASEAKSETSSNSIYKPPIEDFTGEPKPSTSLA